MFVLLCVAVCCFKSVINVISQNTITTKNKCRYEKKPAEAIQKDIGNDYLSRLSAALTAIRGVNRTDVKTLGDKFGFVAAMFNADVKELQTCAGIGSTKAKRLYETYVCYVK